MITCVKIFQLKHSVVYNGSSHVLKNFETNNNHKNLKKGQLKDLKAIDNKLSSLLIKINEINQPKKIKNIYHRILIEICSIN